MSCFNKYKSKAISSNIKLFLAQELYKGEQCTLFSHTKILKIHLKMGTIWTPYPGCQDGGCRDPECCKLGGLLKSAWPEVVGMHDYQAIDKIKRENTHVGIVIIYEGVPLRTHICCNRVFLVLDRFNRVIETPTVG